MILKQDRKQRESRVQANLFFCPVWLYNMVYNMYNNYNMFFAIFNVLHYHLEKDNKTGNCLRLQTVK